MESHKEWELRTQAALQWLRKSIAATGGRGSAHSWHPLLGWNKSYPETTGYIIPTLFDYATLHQDESLRILAMHCAKWLCTIQLPSGAFPALLLGSTSPSIFNSTQILFGLTRALREDVKNEAIRQALGKCVDWLLAQLEKDGSWKQHAFVPGFTPSYYTQAVSGVLAANMVLQDPDIQGNMQHALSFYASRFQPNNAVRDWGFKPGEAAFTHTIAYTLVGFLDCAIQLMDKHALQKTIAAADHLLAVRAAAGGRTAGRYDEAWKGDFSFVCVTGNAQLSVFYQRMFETRGEKKYQLASKSFLREILDGQKLSGNSNRVGGLPGSVPIWGAYLPFRYPNWAVKFFLDAMLPFQQEEHWLRS